MIIVVNLPALLVEHLREYDEEDGCPEGLASLVWRILDIFRESLREPVLPLYEEPYTRFINEIRQAKLEYDWSETKVKLEVNIPEDIVTWIYKTFGEGGIELLLDYEMGCRNE
jgi:hypothetical protein